MQLKLIFIVCLTLVLNGIEGSKICLCHCCRSTACSPIFVGSLSIGDVCNLTTCNQNVCFGFDANQCPAVGSTGNVYSICSSAYSTFQHTHLTPIIMTFLFLMKFYQ